MKPSVAAHPRRLSAPPSAGTGKFPLTTERLSSHCESLSLTDKRRTSSECNEVVWSRWAKPPVRAADWILGRSAYIRHNNGAVPGNRGPKLSLLHLCSHRDNNLLTP